MTDPWDERYICLYMNGGFQWQNMVNVAKYTSPMDPVGYEQRSRPVDDKEATQR